MIIADDSPDVIHDQGKDTNLSWDLTGNLHYSNLYIRQQ